MLMLQINSEFYKCVVSQIYTIEYFTHLFFFVCNVYITNKFIIHIFKNVLKKYCTIFRVLFFFLNAQSFNIPSKLN